MSFTIGSLFTGIGGLGVGLREVLARKATSEDGNPWDAPINDSCGDGLDIAVPRNIGPVAGECAAGVRVDLDLPSDRAAAIMPLAMLAAGTAGTSRVAWSQAVALGTDGR